MSKEKGIKIWKNLEELGFSSYSISSYGEVKNEINGVELKKSTKVLSNKTVRLIKDDGTISRKSIPALMLKVFKGLEIECGKTMPVFIDGNPDNFHIDNLDVKPIEQNRIAIKIADIVVSNQLTGEEFIFPSMKEASEFMNVSRNTMLYHLKLKVDSAIKDTWYIRYGTEEDYHLYNYFKDSLPGEEWFHIDKEEKLCKGNYVSNFGRFRFKTRLIDTLVEDSLYDKPTVLVPLNTDNRSYNKFAAVLVLKYVCNIEIVKGKQCVKFKDGDYCNIHPSNLDIQGIQFSKKSRKKIKVTLVNVETGESIPMDSVSEAERYLGYSKASLVTAFRRNPDKIYRGYKIIKQ